MIGEVFKPSAAKLGLAGGSYKLIRSKGWTSNGFWMIKSELEPDYIKRLKETNTTADVDKILIGEKDANYKLEVNNELKTGEYKTVVVKMVVSIDIDVQRELETWVNVYYLSLFLNLEMWRRVTFWQNGPLDQIFVKSQGEVIGVIAPVRSE